MDALPTSLPPGFRPQEAKDAKLHLTYAKREARRDKHVKRGSLLLNLLLGGALIAAAYGSAFVLPMVRVVPVFVGTDQDGTLNFAISADQQTPDRQAQQLRAWLWQYVLAHDSYSFGGQLYAWDVVQAMSTAEVFDAYRKYVDLKNKQSPGAILGRRGFVHLKFETGDLKLNADGTGTYRVTYYRIIEADGTQPAVSHWRQDIGFLQTYGAPRWQKDTFNPSSLIITDYAPPDQIGAQ